MSRIIILENLPICLNFGIVCIILVIMFWITKEGRQLGMDLEKLYGTIGSDYHAVCERFCGHERLIEKFVRSFVGDMTFCNLAAAAERFDYLEIERQAHTLKGVAGNLGFDRLYRACDILVSSIRFGQLDEVPENFQKVGTEYGMVCDTVKDLMEN